MLGMGSEGESLLLGTMRRHIGTRILLEVKVVVLLLGSVNRLCWVRRFVLLHLGFLLLIGEFDDTACDCFTLTFAVAALTIMHHWMLVLVEVIISLVNNDCASNDRVGSLKADEEVSVHVLSFGVEAGLDALEVTDASIIYVKVRVSMLGTEGVKDVANVFTVA